jgi:hypothetical protein
VIDNTTLYGFVERNYYRSDGYIWEGSPSTVRFDVDTIPPAVIPPTSKPSTGQAYLYGEAHAVDKIMNKELELWYDYYHNEGMRHLFIEFPYYTMEFLNIWMQADNDDILDAVLEDLVNIANPNPFARDFYRKIKSECPETIFHGTDVGHQYLTTGGRFLKYLRDNHMENSEQYVLTQEAIEQGRYFYRTSGHENVYRENKMTENFIREFDKLIDENIMGIYGAAHTDFDAMDYYTQSVPCMANQLKDRYGNALHSEDLMIWAANDTGPIRFDSLTINGKKYEAAYFGKQDMSRWTDNYAYREFWRLENAYNDFKNSPKTNEVLPYNNYPMTIETGQVFVIDYIKTDGSIERRYYRSSGLIWNGMPTTEAFIAE